MERDGIFADISRFQVEEIEEELTRKVRQRPRRRGAVSQLAPIVGVVALIVDLQFDYSGGKGVAGRSIRIR